MNNDNYLFPAIFDYADDGITITFPDLPGCISCAHNDQEALYMAKDALRGFLLVSEEFEDEIPTPTPLHKVQTEANQHAVLIDVHLALYRDAYRNRSVKKTLTIPAWLNELAEKDKVNFSLVLQNALKNQLNLEDNNPRL